ncbi:MAG: HAD family hydrolase, partial [Mesorhizobium sp.]
MMAALGIDIASISTSAEALQAEGKTAMFVAVGNKLAGIVAVADPIKATTSEAIKALHERGLKVIMATGDNERTAKAIASKLGIDEVRAGLLPQQKSALFIAWAIFGPQPSLIFAIVSAVSVLIIACP